MVIGLSLLLLAAPTDVTRPAERAQNLLEYVESREDLTAAERAELLGAVKRTFGGKALADGNDEGITTAKSVLSGALFFGVDSVRAAKGAYAAYHDVARWVPPPVAINYQLLSFQGRAPRFSAREMAYDFVRHYDPNIAPELVQWWEEMLAAGRIPRIEEREVRRALAATRARLRDEPTEEARPTPLPWPPPATREAPKPNAPAARKRQLEPWQGPIAPPPGFAARLRASVAEWLGTPYRFGGTSRSGVDCSAFARAVVRATLALEIPRNARGQAGIGAQVQKSDLQPGDLVFFDTLDRGHITHVGVYLGEGRFAHASSSRGVVRDALEKRYYTRAYRTSRRLLR